MVTEILAPYPAEKSFATGVRVRRLHPRLQNASGTSRRAIEVGAYRPCRGQISSGPTPKGQRRMKMQPFCPPPRAARFGAASGVEGHGRAQRSEHDRP